jgi:hypothetical protein
MEGQRDLSNRHPAALMQIISNNRRENMDNTIENETITQRSLDAQVVEHRKTKEKTGDIFRADLNQVTVEELNTQFKESKIPLAASELIRQWADPSHELSEECPSWMQSPETNDQILALTASRFEPALYRKAFQAIDLEHRKVTEEDGKVATEVPVRDKSGTALVNKDGTTKMRWNADGKRLFSANELSNLFNFVKRLAALMDLEPMYNEKRNLFIQQGGTTVQLNFGKTKLVQTMVKERTIKGKKKTLSDGKTYSDDEILEMANRGLAMLKSEGQSEE